MDSALLFIHNLLRWVILLLLVLSIFRAYKGWKSRKMFSKSDKQLGLFLMISAHIQFVIGLYQWAFGPVGLQQIKSSGMAVVMKDSVLRYWAVEHITVMIIAIGLITVGRSITKKSISDTFKFKRSFWMYLLALILILATAPWPGRKVGRPLIPGGTVTTTAAQQPVYVV